MQFDCFLALLGSCFRKKPLHKEKWVSCGLAVLLISFLASVGFAAVWM